MSAWKVGDIDTLVRSQIRYAIKTVYSLCKKYGYSDIDACESEAMAALVRICQRFDPTKSARLSTYCQPRLRGAVIDVVRATVRNDELTEDHTSREVVDRTDLYDCIDRLPVNERRVIRLHLLGHTFREIAKDINLSPQRVHQLYRQALGRLRVKLTA